MYIRQKPRLVLLEKALRLAQRHARHSNKPRLPCFLLGSMSVDADEEGVTVTLDRFDPGRDQGRVPSALLPGDVLVPCVFSTQEGASDAVQSEAELHHCFKALQQCVSSRQALELSQLLKVRGHVVLTQQADCAAFVLSWSAVCPSVSVEVTFLTMDQTRKLLLLLESDPKACSLPLVGLWLSGVTHIYSPQVWAWCLRFLYSAALQDRVFSESGCFLLVLFGSTHRAPQFFQCRGSGSHLDYQLLSGSQCATLYQQVCVEGRTLQCELMTDSRHTETFREAHTSFNRASGLSVCDQDSGVEDEDLSPRPSPSPHPPAQQARRVQPSVPELSLLIDSSFSSNQNVRQAPGPSHRPPPDRKSAPPPGNSSSSSAPLHPHSTPNSHLHQPCSCCSSNNYNCTSIFSSPGLHPTPSSLHYHQTPSSLHHHHQTPPQSTHLHTPQSTTHPAQHTPLPPSSTRLSSPSHFQTPPPSSNLQSNHTPPPPSYSNRLSAPLPAPSSHHLHHHTSLSYPNFPPPSSHFLTPPPSCNHQTNQTPPPSSHFLTPPPSCNHQTNQTPSPVPSFLHQQTPPPPSSSHNLYHNSPLVAPPPSHHLTPPPSSSHPPPPSSSPPPLPPPSSLPPPCPCSHPGMGGVETYQLLLHQDQQLRLLQAQVQMLLEAQGKLQTPHREEEAPRSTASIAVGTGASLFWGAPSVSDHGVERSDITGQEAACSPPSQHSLSGLQSPVLGESVSMYQPQEEQQNFYQNLMSQLTSRLQESDSKQEVEESRRRSLSATVRQLQQLGVNVEQEDLSEASRVLQNTIESSSTLASINPAAVLSRLSVPSPSASALFPGLSADLSLEANAIALRYLSDSQLSRLSLGGHAPSHRSPAPSANVSLMSPSNMSLATRKYMKRYGLIEEEDGEEEEEEENRPPLTEALNVNLLPQSQLIRELRPKMHLLVGGAKPDDKENCPSRRPSLMRASSRRTEGSVGNILDLSRLRQLPKLF
ncbi:SCL-interrupting locus protein like [Dissostichus eleginoides]|uniref:SCL-interrupting locus protein like n=1 Tax=Dissostichus eleginoides TaxID=100907 RepID=A0AAD9C5M5_DISEL|nr:SCL-interrupting locus protein like [Dissostichus eleginoides]